MKNKIGIYGIKNIYTGKMYVGSSIDIDTRINHHISLLQTNKYSNSELQEDYNLSGMGNFSFRHLLHCDEDELIVHEDRIINSFDKVYNKRTGETGRYQRTNPKRIQLGIRLPSYLILAIEEAAKDQNRTPSNFVETILKKELDLL